MTFRLRVASGHIFAAVLAASGSAVAQQPYPDLKGVWIGQMQFLRQGTTEHFPSNEETGPDFVEAPWTLVIDRQEGNRFFSGTWGRTEGTRRDPVLGVIQTDRTTIHMVDDDGTFLGILAEPDAMEVCRTEVTAVSRNVGCAEFTRRR
jgi:hypothetical protein